MLLYMTTDSTYYKNTLNTITPLFLYMFCDELKRKYYLTDSLRKATRDRKRNILQQKITFYNNFVTFIQRNATIKAILSATIMIHNAVRLLLLILPDDNRKDATRDTR